MSGRGREWQEANGRGKQAQKTNVSASSSSCPCFDLRLDPKEIAAAGWTPLRALISDEFIFPLEIGSPMDGVHSCVRLPVYDLALAPGIPWAIARQRFQLWGLTLTIINSWLTQCKLRAEAISHSAKL